MLKFIFVLLFVISAATPSFAEQKYTACAKAKTFKTPVVFDLQIPDPAYDFSLSRKEMNANQQQVHDEWLKKNGMETVWQAQEMETLGQAAGGGATLTEMKVVAAPYDRYGTSWCPYFQSVRVNIIYRTIINIPKNFKQGGCMFNHILEHEQRHHLTNAQITQEIVSRLEKDMPTIIAEIEGSLSYVTKPQVQDRFKLMQDSLSEAVKVYMTFSMKQEMAKRNALIDTLEEYKKAGVYMQECKGK